MMTIYDPTAQELHEQLLIARKLTLKLVREAIDMLAARGELPGEFHDTEHMLAATLRLELKFQARMRECVSNSQSVPSSCIE